MTPEQIAEISGRLKTLGAFANRPTASGSVLVPSRADLRVLTTLLGTDVPALIAEIEGLKKALKDACDQMIASEAEQANATIDLHQSKARIRDLLANMRRAVEAGDLKTIAMNIGGIAAHVEADR